MNSRKIEKLLCHGGSSAVKNICFSSMRTELEFSVLVHKKNLGMITCSYNPGVVCVCECRDRMIAEACSLPE